MSYSLEERKQAALKLSKNERQLTIMHLLRLSNKKMTKEEIIAGTAISPQKINGDVFNLRNGNSNVSMSQDESGNFLYEFVGDPDFLERLPELSKVALDIDSGNANTEVKTEKKTETKAVETNTKTASKVDDSHKVSDNVPSNTNSSLISKIAAFALSENKMFTVQRAAKMTDSNIKDVEKALTEMSAKTLIEETLMSDYDEAVFKANAQTESVIGEVEETATEVTQKKEASPSTSVKENIPKQSTVKESKITPTVVKRIMNAIKNIGNTDGAKGKNAIIKSVYDEVKSLKIPKQEIEEFVLLLIEDDTLVVGGEDGRGFRYIHKDVESKAAEMPTEVKNTTAIIKEAEVKPAKERMLTTQDFSSPLVDMIEKLNSALSANNPSIGNVLEEAFTGIVSHVKTIEKENAKYREAMQSFVKAVN